MTIDNDEQLQAFLERVIRLSDERGRALSEDEVHEIGLDVGLTEEDLALAKEEGLEHLERARNFLGYGRLDDAIAELEDAIVLLPGRIEARSQLAHTLFERFQKFGNRDDLERAEALVRQCLDIDPNFRDGYELLNAIDQASGTATSKGGKRVMVAAAASLVLLLGAGAGFFLVSADAPQPGPSEQVAVPPAVKTPVSDQNTTSSEPSKAAKTRGAHDIPIELVDKANSGLELEVRKAKLDVYPESAFFKFRGFLKAPTGLEFSKVEASLQLLDAESRQVAELSTRGILDSHQPALRPGGTHPFHLLQEGNNTVTRATLTIESAESFPSDGNYPDAKPIEASFEEGTPSGFELAFGQRDLSTKKNTLVNKDKRHFRGYFEVENNSGRAIKLLKVRARFYDKRGELLSVDKLIDKDDLTSQETYVVSTSSPALLPGETRAFAILATVPETYETYRLSVSELR